MCQRILAVDDDPKTTRALKTFLESRGFTVREENDPAQALEAAKAFQPHVVILDYLMPRVHGGDVAWQLASDKSLNQTKMIICSGAPTSEIAAKLPPIKIPILEKPVDSDSLLQLIQST